MAGGEEQRYEPVPDHPSRSCEEDARHAAGRYVAAGALAPAITPVRGLRGLPTVGGMDRIDGLIAHIKRDVRLREQRRRAGAGSRELEQHSAEIRRVQTQLAYAVRDRLHSGAVLAGPRHALPEHSSQARR